MLKLISIVAHPRMRAPRPPVRIPATVSIRARAVKSAFARQRLNLEGHWPRNCDFHHSHALQ
jgi:hypothetical protein